AGVEVHVNRRSWLGQPSAVGRAVTIPLTAVAFYALHRWGAIAHIRLWVLYLILGSAGVASFLAERRWPAHCTQRQLHARVAIDIAATTSVIYAIGWGPTLAIGYVFVVANEFRKHGSRVWPPSLVKNASDAICVVDAENKIVTITPAIELVTGYPPETYLGGVGFDFIHPDDLAAAAQVYAEALEQPGRVLRAELRAVHRDGSWR